MVQLSKKSTDLVLYDPENAVQSTEEVVTGIIEREWRMPTVRALDTDEDLAYWMAIEYVYLLDYARKWCRPKAPLNLIIRMKDDVQMMLADEFPGVPREQISCALGDALRECNYPFERLANAAIC